MQSMLLEYSKPSAAALVGGATCFRVAEPYGVQASDVDERARPRRRGGASSAGGALQRRDARWRTPEEPRKRRGVLRAGRAERGTNDEEKLEGVVEEATACEAA